MIIKVLGPGCMNCQRLEARVRKAVEELGLEATIEKVTEYPDIMAYGIMSTPGLVVDEQVKFAGFVPSLDELKEALRG
jgi:small redox-active disulfide protein 2